MINHNTNTLPQWEQKITAYLQDIELDDSDASHDFAHFQRVWHTAQSLMEKVGEPVNELVVLAACYFHDVVILPKNDPNRGIASTLAAQKTKDCLAELSFPEALIDPVCHAVASHSFSAGITPETIEAKIVQDADRMEALGAIGLARVFYTAGVLRHKLFDPQDPLAEDRELNDRQFALDHFQQKLLTLPATMQTQAGRQMAEHGADFLRTYMVKLCNELQGCHE